MHEKALDSVVKDWERAAQGAFDTAEKDHQMLTVKSNISATLRSRLPGKTVMELLKKRKMPLHPTGLMLSL